MLSVIFDHHARLGQGPQLLAVQTLVAKTPVETFHKAVLPRTAGFDVDGLADTFTVTFVNYVACGRCQLSVLADSKRSVAESIETNNQATVNYVIVLPPAAPLSNSGSPTEP